MKTLRLKDLEPGVKYRVTKQKDGRDVWVNAIVMLNEVDFEPYDKETIINFFSTKIVEHRYDPETDAVEYYTVRCIESSPIGYPMVGQDFGINTVNRFVEI